MRALSPLKKLASAHPSRRLSPASKYSLSSCVKPGWTQGRRTCLPCPATSARNNAPWPHNSASMIGGRSAYPMGSSASPTKLKLGTKKAILRLSEEQSSYFSADLAVKQNNILIALIDPSGPQRSRGRHVRSGSDPSRARRGSRGIPIRDTVLAHRGLDRRRTRLPGHHGGALDLPMEGHGPAQCRAELPLDHRRADRTAYTQLEQGARLDRARRRSEGAGQHRHAEPIPEGRAR